jgi:hypothetical protein
MIARTSPTGAAHTRKSGNTSTPPTLRRAEGREEGPGRVGEELEPVLVAGPSMSADRIAESSADVRLDDLMNACPDDGDAGHATRTSWRRPSGHNL